jgi:hypothetical protein
MEDVTDIHQQFWAQFPQTKAKKDIFLKSEAYKPEDRGFETR